MTDLELNQAVAKQLGSKTTCQCDPLYAEGHTLHYSTDIKAAWGIVEFMAKQVFSKRIAFMNALRDSAYLDETSIKPEPFYWMLYHMKPIDICKAFLKLP